MIHPRLKLLLLMIVFVVPMLLAAVLFFNIDKLNLTTTNAGTLISPPLQSQGLHLTDTNGAPLDMQGKWWIVYYTPSSCDSACAFNVEKIDSVHRALGREYDRAKTLLLGSENIFSPLESVMAGQIDPLIFNKTAQPQLEALFHSEVIFIIDPLGYIILRYKPDVPGNAILRDLRHLLKVSQVG